MPSKAKEEPLVAGEVVVDKNIRQFSGATVHIYLEDTSRSDVSSRIIASQVVSNFSHRQGREDRIKFNLFGESPDPQTTYNLRAHIDLDGGGEVSEGDYITMQSYPVLTYGYPRKLTVKVQEVS